MPTRNVLILEGLKRSERFLWPLLHRYQSLCAALVRVSYVGFSQLILLNLSLKDVGIGTTLPSL